MTTFTQFQIHKPVKITSNRSTGLNTVKSRDADHVKIISKASSKLLSISAFV